MSRHHDEELPTLDLATLEQVTGGAAADSMSMMLPMMMMMRSRQAAAAPAAAPQPAMPKILINGVEQSAQALAAQPNITI
ncbi:MAG TPA: hypothetical protein VIU61_06505 [Kofleriaceae bacterium]